LQATTPEGDLERGVPGRTDGAGRLIFKRAWWRGKNRYDSSPENLQRMRSKCIGRWISWDTALKDKDDAAYTAAVVGELSRTTRWRPRGVPRPARVPRTAARDGSLDAALQLDGKLRGVLIEDKASGTSAYQTLMASASPDLRAC
jgi:phage terminase large subunit-like protein